MVLRAIVAMVAASSLLAAASPAGAGALEDCGQRVIRDWYSGGRVDKVYPLPCYRAAIRALPDDVLQYTDATAAIERALETAREGADARVPRPPDAAQAPMATSAPGPPTADATLSASRARAPAKRSPDPLRVASDAAHDTGAPGLPYPLIALAALSLVLLASGVAAGLAHRHR